MPDEDAAATSPPKKKKLLPIIIVAGLMAAEAGVIFLAVNLLGGKPDAAEAGEVEGTGEGTEAGEVGPGEDVVEITIADTDAFNNRTGRLYVYHIKVSAVVAASNKEKLEQIVTEREATIQDRVNVVVRSADPKHLNEPGLETIRRQIQFELNKIIGSDSLILELLIPKLLQSRSSL